MCLNSTEKERTTNSWKVCKHEQEHPQGNFEHQHVSNRFRCTKEYITG